MLFFFAVCELMSKGDRQFVSMGDDEKWHRIDYVDVLKFLSKKIKEGAGE